MTTDTTPEGLVALDREILATNRLPSAIELAGPLVHAFYALHDLRDRAVAHGDILEHFALVDLTADDLAAARRLLALTHDVADIASASARGCTSGNPALAEALAAMVRSVVYAIVGTEDLAWAVSQGDRLTIDGVDAGPRWLGASPEGGGV